MVLRLAWKIATADGDALGLGTDVPDGDWQRRVCAIGKSLEAEFGCGFRRGLVGQLTHNADQRPVRRNVLDGSRKFDIGDDEFTAAADLDPAGRGAFAPRSETTPRAQPAMIRLSRFQPPTTRVTSAL